MADRRTKYFWTSRRAAIAGVAFGALSGAFLWGAQGSANGLRCKAGDPPRGVNPVVECHDGRWTPIAPTTSTPSTTTTEPTAD